MNKKGEKEQEGGGVERKQKANEPVVSKHPLNFIELYQKFPSHYPILCASRACNILQQSSFINNDNFPVIFTEHRAPSWSWDDVWPPGGAGNRGTWNYCD